MLAGTHNVILRCHRLLTCPPKCILTDPSSPRSVSAAAGEHQDHVGEVPPGGQPLVAALLPHERPGQDPHVLHLLARGLHPRLLPRHRPGQRVGEEGDRRGRGRGQGRGGGGEARAERRGAGQALQRADRQHHQDGLQLRAPRGVRARQAHRLDPPRAQDHGQRRTPVAGGGTPAFDS